MIVSQEKYASSMSEVCIDLTIQFFVLINFGDFLAPFWIGIEDSIRREMDSLETVPLDPQKACSGSDSEELNKNRII
jgi:hypothetical protein